MAIYTIAQLYYNDKYGIMGESGKEILLTGTSGRDLQTAIEMLIVKHTILAIEKMKKEGDCISDLTSVL